MDLHKIKRKIRAYSLKYHVLDIGAPVMEHFLAGAVLVAYVQICISRNVIDNTQWEHHKLRLEFWSTCTKTLWIALIKARLYLFTFFT